MTAAETVIRSAGTLAQGDQIRVRRPGEPESYIVGRVDAVSRRMPGLVRVMVRHDWWSLTVDQEVEVL